MKPVSPRLGQRAATGWEGQQVRSMSTPNARHARLICFLLSAIGLLAVSLVLRNVDQGLGPSASVNVLAKPTPCRQIVGAALQAIVKDASDAETPSSHHELPA